MKKNIYLFATAVFAWSNCVLAADIFFAGDSTLHSRRYLDTREYPAEERCLGSWCDELEHFLKPGVRIVNPAYSGTSTKSFRDEGRWAKLLKQVKPGDFVYIQFGHNDQKKDPKRYASADGAYKDNLRRFAEEVRAKGGKPVFGTSLVRRFYRGSKDDRIADGLGGYPDAVRSLGREIGVPVVDFNAFSRRLVEAAGREESLKWYRAVLNKTDYTHLTRYGAKVMARAFYDEVKKGGYEIAELLRDDALPEMQAFDAPFGVFSNWVPKFPRRDFNIVDYGAKSDGTDSTAAIEAAFAACAAAGGGRVVVPAGMWTTGCVQLKSNCELHLAKDAVLDLLDDPEKYPLVRSSYEGIECLNRSPLIRAYCCTNVAITGAGLIAPRMAEWRKWFKRDPVQYAAVGELYHWGATNAAMSARDMTRFKDAHIRPQLLQFNRCVNVLLDGFRIKESPFWMIHLFHSENCTLRGLDTYAHGHNNDGVDVEMTRDVLIENCRFDQSDDGVVLKSGRNADAWRLHRPTERVVVRNCRYVFAGSVLAVGSELSGGVRDVWAHDCEIEHPFGIFSLKTNRRRGGFIENVWVENIKAGPCAGSVFTFRTKYYYEWAMYPDYELKFTPVRNINVKNVTCRSADYLANLDADEKCPMKGVTLENIRLEAARKGAMKIENVQDIAMKNVSVGSAEYVPWRKIPDWIVIDQPNMEKAKPSDRGVLKKQ